MGRLAIVETQSWGRYVNVYKNWDRMLVSFFMGSWIARDRTRATPPATIKAAAETPLDAAPPVYGNPVEVGATTPPVDARVAVGAA